MKSLQRREPRFMGIVAKTVLSELGAGWSFWVLGCEQSVPSCHLSWFSVVLRVGGELWRTWATHAPMQGPFSSSPILLGLFCKEAGGEMPKPVSRDFCHYGGSRTLTLADSGCIPTRTPSHLSSRLHAGGKWSSRSRSRGWEKEYFLLQDALPSGLEWFAFPPQTMLLALKTTSMNLFWGKEVFCKCDRHSWDR